VTKFGSILYSILHWITYPLARLLFRMKVIGADQVPESGGVLIAANHASYADIPLLGCSIKRQASYMAKVELFRNPVMRWIYSTLGGIPINRYYSREKLGETIRRLKAGGIVIIYPEGARTLDGKMLKPMPGIGMLVCETGVPVVPAYIEGTHDILPVGAKWIRLHPVTVVFGKPIDFKEQISGRDHTKELFVEISRRVMNEIIALSQTVGTHGQAPEKESITGKI
jgi:1-acyl-sn-glycerol-3-phosphate acyltransferase